jgi:hypothetical protein
MTECRIRWNTEFEDYSAASNTQNGDKQVEPDQRTLKFAKAELRKAYTHLVRLKAHRAAGLEVQAAKLSPMVAAGLIPEADVYRTLREASIHNGLAGIETPRVIDTLIREGLERGKLLPLPADLAEAEPIGTNRITGTNNPGAAARKQAWRVANRERYNAHQKELMRLWRAKRRLGRIAG